jgi:hypothetical protein
MKKWACIKIWVCVFVSSKVICFSPFPISCSSPLATKHTLDAQVMCPSPYTFGWIASKSHASLPTLWMNGPPSHMLLLHTLDEWATKSHASPPHFGWMASKSHAFPPILLDEWPPSHMLLPHTLDEWPPSHLLLLHTFGWIVHQVTCFSSTLLDESFTKSHASPPLFGWMGHQVTCFSSTLWMNGPPSHMLLPHTLDEWVSLVQPFCQNVEPPQPCPQ